MRTKCKIDQGHWFENDSKIAMSPHVRFRDEHALLAELIDHVLRHDSKPIRVPELAEMGGFSRFHLTRRFRMATGETLEHFLRRVRLERAAHWLRTTDASIAVVSAECGYLSPEAFARAFREAFEVAPREFRRRPELSCRLYSPTRLHWNSDWSGPEKRGGVECDVVEMSARVAAVWRVVGNYAHLAQGWERLAERFAEAIPKGATFVTIYRDNMWTHPTLDTMRADLGWILRAGEETPKGMRRVPIMAGRYAVSRGYVERGERNDAWSEMSGRWSSPRARDSGLVAYDAYEAWPLPFEKVRTKIFIGLPESVRAPGKRG